MIQRKVIFLAFITFTQCQTVLLSKVNEENEKTEKMSDVSVDPDYKGFCDFMKTCKKAYDTEEEKQSRFRIYKDNLKLIDKMNAEQKTAKFGVNRFADLTKEEFSKKHMGHKHMPQKGSEEQTKGKTPGCKTPSAFDWRNNTFYPPCQDQSTCGSCYAFATTGVLDILCSLKYSALLYFSKQQVVDCSFDTWKCNGSNLVYPYRYLKNVGVVLEKDYPYTHVNGTCYFNPAKNESRTQKVSKYFRLHGEAEIEEYLCLSPISIGLNADALQFYVSGIMDPTDKQCPRNPKKANHALIIVGVGNATVCGDTIEYWVLRNSWGTIFGEDGHVRIIKGINACGIGLNEVFAAEIDLGPLTPLYGLLNDS